jgi:hypothetical protein
MLPSESKVLRMVVDLFETGSIVSNKMTNMNPRETDGRYAYLAASTCICGHTFGQHTAYKGTNGKHECCEDCSCEGFTPARSRRAQ